MNQTTIILVMMMVLVAIGVEGQTKTTLGNLPIGTIIEYTNQEETGKLTERLVKTDRYTWDYVSDINGKNIVEDSYGEEDLGNLLYESGHEWRVITKVDDRTYQTEHYFDVGGKLVDYERVLTESVMDAAALAAEISKQNREILETHEAKIETEKEAIATARQAHEEAEKELIRKTIESAEQYDAHKLLGEREAMKSDNVAEKYGFSGSDAINFVEITPGRKMVIYQKGNKQLIVRADKTTELAVRSSPTGPLLYEITYDDKDKPVSRTLNEEAFSDLKGSYSDNKAIVDDLHKQGFLTDEQYDEADGGWFGVGQENIQDILKMAQQKLEVEEKAQFRKAEEEAAALSAARKTHEAAASSVTADVRKQIDDTTRIADELTKIVEQNDARIKKLQDKIDDTANYNTLSDEEKNNLNQQLRNAIATRDRNKISLEANKAKLAKLQTSSGITLAPTPPAVATAPKKGINLGAIFEGDPKKAEEAQKKAKEYKEGLEKIKINTEIIRDYENEIKARENDIIKLENEIASETKPDIKQQKNAELLEHKTSKTNFEQILTLKQKELNDLREQNVKTYNEMITLQHEGENILKNTVSVMRSLMKAYDTYPGIGRLSSLFLTGDSWTKWRDDVNKVLCDTIILGGKKCWVSKICDQYLDATPGGNSLIARTPGGPKAVVNLQAERSLPIEVPGEGTQFIYKLTYTITNPHDKPMHYNLRFYTKDGTYEAFKPQKELQAGASDGKTGSAAFHKQSTKDYTQVCLIWQPSIETWSKRSVSEFCEPITQYEGAATNPYTNLPTQPGTCNDKLQNQGETGTDCGGPCPACGTTKRPTEFDGF